MSYNTAGVHLPKLTRICKILMIICAGVFLIQSVFTLTGGFPLKLFLGLSAFQISNGHIYELITYPFVGSSLIEVLFNCVILWFIGSELESLWGEKRFLNVLGVVIIGAAALYLLITTLIFEAAQMIPLSGFAGVANALILAYAIIYPNRTFMFMLLFPMKAKYFCMLLIGIQLYIGVFSPGGVLAWGHLGGMFSIFVYMMIVSSSSFKKYVEKSKFKDIIKQKKKEHHKKRANLTLVGDDDENDKKDPKLWQ